MRTERKRKAPRVGERRGKKQSGSKKEWKERATPEALGIHWTSPSRRRDLCRGTKSCSCGRDRPHKSSAQRQLKEFYKAGWRWATRSLNLQKFWRSCYWSGLAHRLQSLEVLHSSRLIWYFRLARGNELVFWAGQLNTFLRTAREFEEDNLSRPIGPNDDIWSFTRRINSWGENNLFMVEINK